jgi:hypothetical protein
MTTNTEERTLKTEELLKRLATSGIHISGAKYCIAYTSDLVTRIAPPPEEEESTRYCLAWHSTPGRVRKREDYNVIVSPSGELPEWDEWLSFFRFDEPEHAFALYHHWPKGRLLQESMKNKGESFSLRKIFQHDDAGERYAISALRPAFV